MKLDRPSPSHKDATSQSLLANTYALVVVNYIDEFMFFKLQRVFVATNDRSQHRLKIVKTCIQNIRKFANFRQKCVNCFLKNVCLILRLCSLSALGYRCQLLNSMLLFVRETNLKTTFVDSEKDLKSNLISMKKSISTVANCYTTVYCIKNGPFQASFISVFSTNSLQ